MTNAYISATQKDLSACRKAVHEALRALGIEDVAMEAYVAETRAPLERCLADVRQSDIYIGIFAWRYGFRPPAQTLSITELEYREAVALRKPCFIFLLAEDAPWSVKLVDSGVDRDQIDDLRGRLALDHVCSFFTGPEDLSTVVVTAVANYLRGGQAAPESPGEPGAELTTAICQVYFTRLRQQYHGIELDALNPGPVPDYLSIGLRSIFVEPTVRRDTPPDIPRAWWNRARPNDDSLPEERPERKHVALLRDRYHAKSRRPLFDVVGNAAHRRLVLLGDPGSGKSAVTRYLALALADDRLEPRLEVLRGHLPVLIELRSYLADADDGHCDGFLAYLDHRDRFDRLGLPRQALEPHLRAGGRALFLFDGLDEILDPARRARVVGQIAAFAADFTEVRILVTTRTVGYVPRALTDAGFGHYTLDDLADGQIDRFLQGWYRLTMPDRPGDAVVHRERIHHAIATSPAIKELAGNPLLLTILAIVAREQELPRERWQLYDHAAEVLISRWDVDRHLRGHDERAGPLGGDVRKALLQRLALRMQSRDDGTSGNYIDKPDLVHLFEDYLVERHQYARPAATVAVHAIIDQFRQRNFILGRYGQRLYGFVHRTFLEFFCAQAIVQRFKAGDPAWDVGQLRALFADHWADPSWREVLRLIVGALPTQLAGSLIIMLATEVNRPWPPEEFAQPPWNLALAAQCVAEMSDVAAVPEAASTVLKQLILLVEHGVSIEDRSTVELAEEEILPAVRVVGASWPGREAFLYWFNRRGIRFSWTTGSAFACRIAALLGTADDAVEAALDRELGSIADRRARYALVAGLGEAVARSAVAGRATEPRRRARCRELLAVRAVTDPDGVVRLAALEALGTHFDRDSRTSELLMEQAQQDPSPEVRLTVLQTLSGRRVLSDEVSGLLLDRAARDPDPLVRRAAVDSLGRHRDRIPEARQELLARVRDDEDAGVLDGAVRALVAAGAAEETGAVLVGRVRVVDVRLRRCMMRLVAECCSTELTDALLRQTILGDTDAGCRTVALQEAIRLGLDELGLLLADRAAHDPEGSLRLLALQTLTDRTGPDRELLTAAVVDDADAAVRAAGLRLLAEHFPDGRTLELLIDRAGSEKAAVARRVATQLLAERFTGETGTRDLISAQVDRERDTVIRLAATRNLIRIGTDRRSHERLLEQVAHDVEPQIIREAAAALMKWAEHRDQLYRLLLERAHDDYPRIRLTAVATLVAGFDGRKVLPLLLELAAKDPDPAVFALVAESLCDGALCDARTVVPLLLDRATQPNPAIRAPAVTVLGSRYGSVPEVLALVIDKARADPDIGVRRAAVQELGGLAAEHPQARTLLTALIADEDWSVRRGAVQALGRQADPDGGIRTLFMEHARRPADLDTLCLFTQALTWLPDADPDDLPDARPGM